MRSTEEPQRVLEKSSMQSFKIIDKNLAAVTLKQTKIFTNKLTVVGAYLLELAKFHMFSFHYKILKKPFDNQLIYSDTDSLLYKMSQTGLHKTLAGIAKLYENFDFTNYLKNHSFYRNGDKMVTLFSQDEMTVKILGDFVELQPICTV